MAASTMRHHIQGINWMLERELQGGGILADEPGLNKKLQMIMTMIKNPKPRTLIVVPFNCLYVWTEVLMAYDLHVIQLNTEKAWNSLKEPFVKDTYYIINYQKINRRRRLLELTWDRIVFYDARILQNPANKIFIAASQLLGNIRWLIISDLLDSRQKSNFFDLLKVEPNDDLILRRSLYRIQGGPPKPDIYKVEDFSDDLFRIAKKPAVIYCYNSLEVEGLIETLNDQKNIYTCYKEQEVGQRLENLQLATSDPEAILIVCTRGILQSLKLPMFKTIFFNNPKISPRYLELLIRRVTCIGQKHAVQVFLK